MNLQRIYDDLEEAFKKSDVDYYLIGAQARNLWYEKKKISKLYTQDIDFVVVVPAGERYDQLKKYLAGQKKYTISSSNAFALISPEGVPIDLLPIDQMEPDQKFEAKVSGLEEIYQYGTVKEHLSTGHEFRVATLPAIVALKLIAFDDRPEQRDKDPIDIADIFKVYFDIESENIYEKHNDLFIEFEYVDLIELAAIVIGREIATICSGNNALLHRLINIIQQNINKGYQSALIRNMVIGTDKTIDQYIHLFKRILSGLQPKSRASLSLLTLKGKGNSGKTTTIKNLYLNIIEAGGELLKILSGDPTAEVGDFTVQLRLGEKVIGITSAGDTYDSVSYHLNQLLDASCDYFVCACRSFDRGRGTNTAVHEFVQRHSIKLQVVNQERKELFYQIPYNNAQAEIIFGIIIETFNRSD